MSRACMATISDLLLQLDKTNPRIILLLVLVALVPAAIAVALFVRQCHRHLAAQNGLSLPPCPPKSSIISGHLPDVMRAAKGFRQHLLFDEWVKQYGEIYYVQVGPFQEFFINSDRAVKAILDKASAQTAERPRWIVSSEQMANGMNLLLLSASNKTWKHQRRVTAAGLTSVSQADAGLPFLHFETLKFLDEIASDPAKGADATTLWKSIGRYTYSTFSSQTFGLDIPTNDNPAIQYMYDTGSAQILGMLPGAWMVDVFPFLEKLPSAFKKWERDAKARHGRDYKWCSEKLERLRQMDVDEDSPVRSCLLSKVLEDPEHMGFNCVEDAAYLCLILVIGAADTSRLSTWAFLEAMLMFPEVCKKAQTLLDEVVGDRVPIYEDMERVPYIRCLMKEVWRWRPPVALGHPHVTTREIVYENYRIPKRARLHLNTWAIHHDPARYEDPDRFMPERYEGDTSNSQQSAASADVSQRDHFAFGAGRRICPGYHVADRSLAVAIMRMLWAFNFTVRPGTPLPLDPRTYPDEFPGMPGPGLPVVLTARNAQKLATIQGTYQEAVKVRTKMEPLVVV